nr:upf0481 protein [Quercus suber]
MANSAIRENQPETSASASIRTSTECRIYKVPRHLRKWNEEAYTPHVISIGPIHHGNKRFQTMEKHKVRCFESFKQRTGINSENFVRIIRQMEYSIRQCYVETVAELESDDFVKMIMLDAQWRRHLQLRVFLGTP